MVLFVTRSVPLLLESSHSKLSPKSKNIVCNQSIYSPPIYMSCHPPKKLRSDRTENDRKANHLVSLRLDFQKIDNKKSPRLTTPHIFTVQLIFVANRHSYSLHDLSTYHWGLKNKIKKVLESGRTSVFVVCCEGLFCVPPHQPIVLILLV